MDQNHFNECFEINPKSPSGIFWKERPQSHFKCDQAHKTFNKKYAGKKVGAKNGSGRWHFTLGGKKGKDFFCSRVIWIMVNGAIPDGLYVDHQDGDKSNNKIENLRLATPSQNTKSQSAHIDSASGLRGVAKSKNKWSARFYHKGKNLHLGIFKDPQKAHEAWAEMARLHHGEFFRKQ